MARVKAGALHERVAIRFPAFARLLGGGFMRLSPRSRFRQLLVTRPHRAGLRCGNRRDYESVLAGWDPESEYRPSRDLMPPTWMQSSTATMGCTSSGAIGVMHSRTSAGTPRRSRTSEQDPYHRSAEGARVWQRRRRQRAGIPAVHASSRLRAEAGRFFGSLGSPRSPPGCSSRRGISMPNPWKRPLAAPNSLPPCR